MDEIVAEADVPLVCRIVDARISTAMYRYFRPVLLHARLKGPDGATPKSLSEDLFVGMEPMSRRLLEICADEGMVERTEEDGRFVISQRGSDAIDEGRVLVRDTRRMWKIYHTECEIVPAVHRILLLDTGSNEAAYQRDDDSHTGTISSEMGDLTGCTMIPVLGKSAAPFRIEEFNSRYEKVVKTDVRVRLHLRLAESGVRLELDGYDGGKRIGTASVKSEKTWEEVVEEFLDGGGGYRSYGSWDREKRGLVVRFGDTSSEERASMKRTIVFERPEVYGCRFDGEVRIRVDIHPEDDGEAEKWAKWLVGHRVGELIRGDEYKKIRDEIAGLFPKFDLNLKGDIAEYFEEDGYSGW